jgi:hypothetical protein
MRSAVGAFCVGPRDVARLFRFGFFFFGAGAESFEEKLAAVLDCRGYGRAVAGALGRPVDPFDVIAQASNLYLEARSFAGATRPGE